MSIISVVMAIAASQYGAISTIQLRSAGMSARAQNAAVAAGWLVVANRNVLIVAGSPASWHRRLQIGLLTLGPDAWVSHEAAARLHRFDRAHSEALHFTVFRSRRGATVSDGTVHTTECVDKLDLVMVDGLRCASATRTVIDLAALGLPEVRLSAAIDSSVSLFLSAPHVLERRLGELRGSGRAGARLIASLLIDAGGETMLERRFLTLVRTARLPRPTTQRRVRRDDRHVARVDFMYERLNVVVEVTGRRGHSSPSERERDAQRRNELQDLGYAVYEYTWGDVINRPAYVMSTLRDRLDRAARVTGGRGEPTHVAPMDLYRSIDGT